MSQASQSTIQEPEILGFAGNVASVLPIKKCPPFFHPSPLLANPIKGFLHKTFNDMGGDELEKRRQR
jgi:hypothetical protein